jgi:hypothetical protein
MPRPCRVPEELRYGVFSLDYARAMGITREDLRRSAWQRVAHGWYRWKGCQPQEEHLLIAIAATMPEGGAFSGLTAARRLGIEVASPKRPEIVVPDLTRVAHRAPATVRCIQLAPEDVVWRDGFPVTSPVRTCFDLAARLPLVEAVAAVDMALHGRVITLDRFRGYVAEHKGIAGVVKARQILEHLEPKSESPMESRLRMLLVLGGLPRPEAQVSLTDSHKGFVARVDLFYADARLAVEYDGEQHRDQLTDDNRRQNRLHEIGVTVLRYTAPDLKERPDHVLTQVRAALSKRPFRTERVA